MRGVINRLKENDTQTLGRFYLYNDLNEVFSCVTLELPDRSNQKRISRICGGEYLCVKRHSEKYGNHFHVTDVENRTLILIHAGNYFEDTKGCLLFGDDFALINSDEYTDITNSKDTLKDLLEIAPNEWILTVNEI